MELRYLETQKEDTSRNRMVDAPPLRLHPVAELEKQK
jgi:hypothetical protein